MAVRPINKSPTTLSSASLSSKEIALELVKGALQGGAIKFRQPEGEQPRTALTRASNEGNYLAHLFAATLARVEKLDQASITKKDNK